MKPRFLLDEHINRAIQRLEYGVISDKVELKGKDYGEDFSWDRNTFAHQRMNAVNVPNVSNDLNE